MINWSRALDICEDVFRSTKLTSEHIAAILENQPCFRNIDYPLALNVLTLQKDAVDRISPTLEQYVALLERVVQLCRTDLKVRSYFQLSPTALAMLEAEPSPVRSIHFCRLDGYITRSSGQLRILENNADSPAGTLFTSRLNCIMRNLLDVHDMPVLPMDTRDAFLDALLAAYRTERGDVPIRLAVILQQQGKSNRESLEVAEALSTRGVQAAVIDPREVEWSGVELVWKGRPIDLVWNKINTVYWNILVAEDPRIVDCWSRALAERAVCHLNSFASRQIAEAKTVLALLHDPDWSHLFTPSEKKVIDELVPWTARVTRDSAITFQGDHGTALEIAARYQQHLVLKQQYDIRGEGVTIGKATEKSEWLELVSDNTNMGAILQEYVQPERYDVIFDLTRSRARLNFSLDTFVFQGRVVGFGSKISASDKVNLFQGGSKMAVVVSRGGG